ncbi:MAG: dihydroorotase [Elusimicrobia bacterium]|nr:dihydroorotase [Elusimicrobiota bacterium]
MSRLLIKNGLLIDPVSGERRGDLLLSGSRIVRAGGRISPPAGCREFDASGLWVFPGFVDLHVHAREPGAEAAETLASAAAAAAAGGVTSALLMPNTSPPMDSPALLREYVSRTAGLPANLYFSAAATTGRAGRSPSRLAALKKAGAAAFTDDGSAIPPRLLPGLIRSAAALGTPLLNHSEDFSRTGQGVINEGPASRRLGVPGIPPAAELNAVLADLLAASSAGPLHLQHLSLASSVAALRAAKACGWKVTGETCPHYFTLSDADIRKDDASFKMKPPLRSPADRDAVLAAVLDGTIDAVATDHAPHEAALKARGLARAPFGIIGLETLAPLCVTVLVRANGLPKKRLAALTSLNPARLLGLERKGRLAAGFDADVAVLDPSSARRVPAAFVSRSSNSPFVGRKLTGWPVLTVLAGKTVFSSR